MSIDPTLDALKGAIRDVPDFPRPGIVFKDITTLLKDPVLFGRGLDLFTSLCSEMPARKVLAVESRGFILGSVVASRLGAGFIPARKPGKLPSRSRRHTYALEYGTDALEVHEDAIEPGERVLVVDDVLATGGTAGAAAALVRELGGQVAGCAFLVELTFLAGRARLEPHTVRSLLRY